jgi:hypothetical protein
MEVSAQILTPRDADPGGMRIEQGQVIGRDVADQDVGHDAPPDL